MLYVDQAAPGHWLAATAPGRLVVMHADASRTGSVRRLWAALAGGIQPVLDVLTSDGLLSTPAFALAEWSGDPRHGFSVRFIVRGSVRVSVETDAGPRRLDAGDVSTWLEQPLTGVTGFRVDCGDAESLEGQSLPLGLGAAWVHSVTFGVDGESQDAALPEVTINESRTAPPSEVTINESLVTEPVARADYDQLFGATLMRPVDAAAIRHPGEPREQDEQIAPTETIAATATIAPTETIAPVAQAGTIVPAETIAPPSFITVPEASTAGDHDGFTMLSGDIDALRANGAAGNEPRPQGPSAPAAPTPPTPPNVPPVEPTFHLTLADGTREPLTGTVIVGRAPSVSKVPGTRVPRLVTVDTPDHDISRNHVQFALEGDTVVVTDLHSRNGTVIVLPGKSPQKLRQGEPTSVIADTVVDLGGGVTIAVGQS